MAAFWTAEDAELMLYTEHIRSEKVEEICSAPISTEVWFEDFESNLRWIIITEWTVIDRNDRTLKARIARGNGAAKVCSKRGEAALSRDIVAKKRHFPKRSESINAARAQYSSP